MDKAYICQDCGSVVAHANTPHDYKDCQIAKLCRALSEREIRIEALEKAIAALRPVYGGVCKVCGNVVSQEGNDIGLDYIEGHAEDCEFAALAAET